jgi:cytochrome c
LVVIGLGCGVAFADQASDGAKLYAERCASCHGDAGEGKKNTPPLIGTAALPLDPRPGAKVRKTQFRTAGDVLEFVSKNMPAKKPGSLQPEEYRAIVEYLLKANGVAMGPQPFDATTAAKIVLRAK